MEDKNQNTGVIYPDSSSPDLSSGLPVAPAPVDYGPGALSGVPLPSPDPAPPRMEVLRRVLKPMLKWAVIAGIVLMFLLGLFLLLKSSKQQTARLNVVNPAASFSPQNIPLSSLGVSVPEQIQNAGQVTVNGQLQVGQGIVLAPSLQPSTPQPGQLYYDQGRNSLGYFNGTGFVFLDNTDTSAASGNVVQQIAGLTGQVGVGAGLGVVGGQLANSGVLSVQGQVGAVAFTAGNGITVNGTTITNSGVVSVTSSNPSVVVNDDGNGNLTLDFVGGGSGTVASAGGTAGRIAKFTSSQNITDSLLSESGTAVTVNGDLSVTGSVALGSPLTVANGGTGRASLAANGVLVGNGTSGITSVVAGSAGLCLVSTGGAPTWSSCTSSTNAVQSLNLLTGNITINDATGLVNQITINSASTSQKGLAQFNGTNFTDNGSGLINTIQNISTTSSPTFNTLTLSGNLVVQGGSSTLGTLSQAGQLAISDGSSNTVTIVADNLSADRVYHLPDAGGNATLCVTSGNCIGGSGSAPNNSTYLVATLDGTLTNERALAGGSNISLTDGGANGSLTVATVQNPTFTTSVTTPQLQSSGALVISSAAGQTVAIDAGTTIELQDSTNVTGSLGVSVALNVGTGNAFAVNSSGVITAAAGITSSGTIVFSALNCTSFANGGVLTTNGSGQLVCSDDDAGAGGGITGSGTANTIPLFNGSQTLTNSIITQSGTTIAVAGNLTLTTDLAVSEGGTGSSSFTSNGVLYGNGSGALQVTAAGTGGQVLVANNSGVPTFVGFTGDVNVAANGAVTIQPDSVALGTDTTGNYVSALGSVNGLTVGGTSGEGAVPTLSVNYGSSANTAVQGNVTLTCPNGTGNLTGGGTGITLGLGGTCGDLSIVNNPTFTTSVTTPQLILTGAGSNGTLEVANLGQATTFMLPDPGQATASICLSTGNCATAGAAGGDLTGNYPDPTIAKLQGTDLAINTPAAGNILVWNGTDSSWENQAVSGDIALGETGIATIQNGAVTNAKLQNSSLTVTAGTGLAGGGSVSLGGSTTLNLADTAVTLGSYGSASQVATFTVDQQGRLTAAGNTSIAIAGAQITSGTIDSSRLDNTTVTLQGNNFNGANQLVQLNASGELPALSGVNLTNLNASALASGTVSTARISGSYTGITGVGTIAAGTWQGNAVGISYGGTGANTAQGAINAISQLTTQGDLLYYNGTNTTRLPRGSNNQCLVSTATTIQWDSCTSGSGISGSGTSGQVAYFDGSGSITSDADLLFDGTTLTTDTLSVTNDAVVGGDVSAATFTGDGSALTNLNGSNISSGTISNSRLTGSGALTVTPGTGLSGGGSVSLGGSTTLNLADTTVTLGSYGSASSVATFTVDQQGRLTAAGNTSIAIAGTQITSGTIDSSRLDNTTVTLQGNTFNGANQLVQLNASGELPALSGVNLTNLNASNLASGTVNTARISGSYTGITGVGTIAVGTWQGAAVGINYGGTGANTSQGAINAISQLTTQGDLLYYNGTDTTRLARGSNNQCLVSTATSIQWDSCTSGGGISGSGVSGQIAYFDGTGSIASDADLLFDGTTLTTDTLSVANDATVSGVLTVEGASATIGTTSQQGSLVLHDGNGQTTTLQAGDSSGNLTFVLPTNAGSASQCLKQSGTGNQLVWDDCEGGTGGVSGVTTLNSLAGALIVQGTTNHITISDNGTDTITLDVGSSVTLQGNTFNGANQLVQLNASGELPAISGVNLTNLNASNLASGTVSTTRISGSYTGITGVGTLTVGTWNATSIADAYINDNITISSSGTVDWTALNNYPAACGAGQAITAVGDTLTCAAFAPASGSGSYINNSTALQTAASLNIQSNGITDVTANFQVLASQTADVLRVRDSGDTTTLFEVQPDGDVVATSFSGNGSGLTNLNGSNISSGTVANARLTNGGALTVTAGTGLSGGGSVALGGSTTLNLADTAVTLGSYGSASSVATFTVDQQGRLTAAGSSSIAIAGTQITSGTIDSSRLDNTTVTLQGNTFNGANQLVQLNGSGELPAISGVNLTNLNASALASGTVDPSRISGSYTGITGVGTLTAGTWTATSIADAYIDNNITISSSGTVDWTALNNYPTACSAGQAVTAVGDTLTCAAFAAASGSGAYINNGTSLQTSANLNIQSNGTTDITANFRVLTSQTADVLRVRDSGDTTTLFEVQPDGDVVATSFSGDGSGLTSLNGSNISSGTIANARLTNSGALTVTAGTGLSGGGSVSLGGSTSLSVSYGSSAGSAVQGNVTLTCPSGTGNLTGGGTSITLGTGGTCGALDTVASPTFTGNVTIQGTTGLTFNTGAGGDITFANGEKIDNDTNGTINLQANSGALTLLLTGTSGTLTNSAGTLTLDSFNNTLTIASSDTTLSATGLTTLNLGSNTSINSGGTITLDATSTVIIPDADTLQTNDVTSTGALSLVSGGSGDITINSAGTIQLQDATTITSTLAVQGASVTVGGNAQLGSLVLYDGSSNTGTIQTASLAANRVYTLPDPGSDATICLSTGNCGAAGTAGGDLTGSYPNPTIAKLQGVTLTAGSPSTNQILQYNGSAWVNQTIGGDISLSGGTATIATGAVTSGKILDGTIANGDLSSGSFTNITGVGTLTGLAVQGTANINTTGTAGTAIGNSTGTFSITSSGGLNVTTGGALTGVSGITTSGGYTQTGSTANSFSGATTFSAAGTALTVSNNATISGTLTTNTITPSGAMTVGATSQNLTLQGNGTTKLTATNSGNTTTVGFATPTANTTINFPALTAGTYTVCTSQGNCAGAGTTLQNAYNNSTNPEITVDATRGALTVRDASSAIGANLLEVQNNAGSTTYFAVTAAGIQTTGTAVSSGNINTTGGVVQTNSTTRIDNSGNLINIGNITGAAAVTLQPAAASALTITAHAASTWSTDSGDLSVQAAGNLNLGNGGGTTINLGSNAGIHTISVGTGAAAQTITIGSTNTTSALTLNAGSNNINMNGLVVLNNLGTANTTTALCRNSSNQIATCTSSGMTIGTIDSQTKSSNGAVISGTTLYMQTADATNPGLVSISAQTIAGTKTFTSDAYIGDPTAPSSGSRLFTDGFEDGKLLEWVSSPWVTPTGSSTIAASTSVVHSGKYSAALNFSGGHVGAITLPRFQPSYTVAVRAYVNLTSYTSGTPRLFCLDGEQVAINPTRNCLYDNAGVLANYCSTCSTQNANTSFNLTAGSGWHKLELIVTSDASAGTVQVYADDTLVLTRTAQNTGSVVTTGPPAFTFLVPWNNLIIGDDTNTSTATAYIDDVVADTVRPGNSASLNVADSLHVDGTTTIGAGLSVLGGPVMIQNTNWDMNDNVAPTGLAAPRVTNTGTGFATASTNHAVLMPATVASGDLLVALITTDGANVPTDPDGDSQPGIDTNSNGWYKVASSTDGSSQVTGSVWQKVADGTEDGTTVNFATTGSVKAAAQVYLIPDGIYYDSWGDISKYIAVQAGTAVTTNNPAPPTLNPPDWDLESAMWMVYVAGSDYDTASAYPSGYPNTTPGATHTTVTGTGSSGASVTSTYRVNTAISESPGTLTMTSASPVAGIPFTIAIRAQNGYTNLFTVNDSASSGLGSALFTVNTSGGKPRVGIGTDDPGHLLDIIIDDNDYNSALYIGNTNSGDHAVANIHLATTGQDWVLSTDQDGFAIYNQSTDNDTIYIDGTTDTIYLNGMLMLQSITSDPSGSNGAMYYNSSSGTIRCYENGTWRNCGGRDYMQASAEADQITNLSNNDHVMFDTTVSSIGSSISRSGAAYPSLGQFTLAAGATYKLEANVDFVGFGASGSVVFEWYDVTHSAVIGTYQATSGDSSNAGRVDIPVRAYITTTASTVVELRMINVSNVNRLGLSGYGVRAASAIIERL